MTIAFLPVVKLLVVHAMEENVSLKEGRLKDMNTVCPISEKTLPLWDALAQEKTSKCLRQQTKS